MVLVGRKNISSVRRYFESKISAMFDDNLECHSIEILNQSSPVLKVKFVSSCTDGREPAKRVGLQETSGSEAKF